jgi:hypothetical protein
VGHRVHFGARSASGSDRQLSPAIRSSSNSACQGVIQCSKVTPHEHATMSRHPFHSGSVAFPSQGPVGAMALEELREVSQV